MEGVKETGARLSIRDWAREDRPREKLVTRGPQGLSDAELLAILIRTGSTEQTALDLAREIMRQADNDLGRLGRLGVPELMRIKGMGEAKAVAITAALELGRRRREAEPMQRPVIRSSMDAYNELQGVVADRAHEEFWLLLLDRGNAVLGLAKISEGGMHGTVADPKRIFKEAIDRRASCIVLCHNHPSGQLRPSEEDVQLTRKLTEGARLLDIVVQDHLIIATGGYFSFADQGML